MSNIRENLLIELRKLIQEKEYKSIRIEDITKGAGVAKGSFYTYFSSKDDILSTLLLNRMVEVEKVLEERINKVEGLDEKVRAYIAVVFESILKDSETLHLLTLLHKIMSTNPKGAMFKKFKPNKAKQMTKILEECKEDLREYLLDRLPETANGLEGFLHRYMIENYLNGKLVFGDEKWLQKEEDFLTKFFIDSIRKGD